MKKIFFLLSILLFIGCQTDSISKNKSVKFDLTNFSYQNFDQKSNLIRVNHTYYTMWYDTSLYSEIIGYYVQTTKHSDTTNNPKLSIDRGTLATFKQDVLLPKSVQKIVTNNEYKKINDSLRAYNQRIDKGHLVPYSAMSFNLIAASESMLLENTCPQPSYFNEHQWEKLEMYVQKTLSPKYDSIQVWTGVLVSKNSKKLRGLYMPEYYWKVIRYKVDDGNVITESFIGENSFTNLDIDYKSLKIDMTNLKKMIVKYYPYINLEF